MTDAVTIPYTIVDKNGMNPKAGTITNMTFAGIESTLTVTGLAAGNDYKDGTITIGADNFGVKSINAARGYDRHQDEGPGSIPRLRRRLECRRHE